MSTIRSIARQVNVSPTTVSMALNGRGNISLATRRRIKEVARQLGYRRRSPGRPRSEPQMQHVVAVNPCGYVQPFWINSHDQATRGQNRGPLPARRVVHHLTTEWLKGIREATSHRQANLSVLLGGQDVQADEVFRETIQNGQVSGVLLYGDIPSTDGYLNWLVQRNCPVVTSSRTGSESETGFSSVVPDNVQGGCRAVEYLGKLGHRRVAFIHPVRRSNWKYQARLAGLGRGLDRLEMTLAGVFTVDLDQSLTGIEAACQAAMQAGATAIVGGNDGVARLAVDALESLGLSVPGQVSVIGFEHSDQRSRLGLQLTSVSYDKVGLGRKAAELLFHLINQQDELSSVNMTIQTHLAVHDTTGPCPC